MGLFVLHTSWAYLEGEIMSKVPLYFLLIWSLDGLFTEILAKDSKKPGRGAQKKSGYGDEQSWQERQVHLGEPLLCSLC